MRRSISIKNRSVWPMWLVRWLVRESAADAGIHWPYTWTQQNTERGWGGSGGRHSGNGKVARRVLTARTATFLNRDGRFRRNDPPFPIPHTSVAVLAFLIRHELEHAADGHPSRFRQSGRTRVSDMEYICNASAQEFVEKLGNDYARVFREWLTLARKERQQDRAALAA